MKSQTFIIVIAIAIMKGNVMQLRVRSITSDFSVCGTCGVVCGNIEILHKVTLCVGPVVWCVRTWSFQSSPVCMPCAVAREDFKFP